VMRHSATASLLALGISVAALLYVDGRNDRDLLRAQEDATQTHCEIASSATLATRSALLKLAATVPGYPPVAVDFAAWVQRCLVIQDCANPTATTPPLDGECAVAPPVVGSAPPGD